MKKIWTLLFSLMMAFATAACVTACGDKSDSSSDSSSESSSSAPCTQHVDNNNDLVCDVCKEEIPAPTPEEITVTFTVKDLEENALAGITVSFYSENEDTVSATSGTNGTFTATLKAATYSVSYDYDVDTLGYYLSNTTRITVAENTVALDLYLENRTPNGTDDRPFTLSVEENQITIPANTAYYYVVYRAVNLYAEIEGENVKVTYGSTEYTPDANGKISIRLLGASTNAVEKLLFANTSATEQTYVVKITSAPGTQGNPYALVLDADVTTPALADRVSVYYTYTATANGTLSITVKSENSYISMTNTTNSVNVNTEEGKTITLTLNVGDTVILDCSVSVSEDATASVVFNAVFTQNA